MKSLNVIINPLIFLWKSKSFRDYLKALVGKKRVVTICSNGQGMTSGRGTLESAAGGEGMRVNGREVRRYNSLNEAPSTG